MKHRSILKRHTGHTDTAKQALFRYTRRDAAMRAAQKQQCTYAHLTALRSSSPLLGSVTLMTTPFFILLQRSCLCANCACRLVSSRAQAMSSELNTAIR